MARRRLDIGVVERTDLRLGTVVAAETLEAAGDLAVLTVRLESEVSCLVAAAALPEGVEGARVVVARGLHPLLVAGTAYRHTVLTETDGSGRLLVVESAAPDGSGLY